MKLFFLLTFYLSFGLNQSHTIRIGGLYTWHTSYKDPGDCNNLIIENVILYMVHQYTQEYINENIWNHINVTLVTGFDDTCDNPSKTLQRTVNLIGKTDGFCQAPSEKEKKFEDWEELPPVIAVTGAFSGEIGTNINYLLQAFCIPVIASASSSAELDNYINYPYFIRAGASDINRAQVILDVLQSQELFHISIIYDASIFGIALTNQFKNLIGTCSDMELDDSVFRDPCVEHFYQISFFDNANQNSFDSEISALSFGMNTSSVRVYVLFMEGDSINALFGYFSIWGKLPGDYQLILPTTNLELSSYLEYAIVVEEHVDLLENLDEIVASYTLNTSGKYNNVVSEAIMHDNLCCMDCSDSTYSIHCNGSETIKNIPEYARLEARNVFNALNIFAHGLLSLFDANCKDGEADRYSCYSLYNYTGRHLLDAMINSSFTDERGLKFQLFNRSGPPSYDVFQFYKGNWQTVLFDYNPYKGAYANPFVRPPIDLPNKAAVRNDSDNCQPSCANGYIPDVHGMCCWECKHCPDNFIVNTTFMNCQNCSEGTMPNATFDGCMPIPKPPMFYNLTPEMYVLMSINLGGCIISKISGLYLYKLRESPMVKASTPDLCFMQTFAQLILFVVSCIMIPSSSMFICGTTWVMLSLFLCYTHAIFLIKAIRLARPIFYVKLHTTLNSKQTPFKTSLIILAIIMVIQFLITILWVSLRPPRPILGWDKRQYCSSNTEFQTCVLMLLPLILVIVTFFYQRQAAKNRILFQVRQARIGLAGTLCFIVNYAVLLPLIFMEDSPENVRSTILMCIPMLTSWISYIAIHFPVCYETFIRKEQNSHEYVSRERSRQFQDGNVVYYVDAIILNRARSKSTETTTT